jgi:hypothetical protein
LYSQKEHKDKKTGEPMQLDNNTILQLVHEGIWAGALSFGGWILAFPLRTAYNTVKEKAKILEELRDELATQRTNCLKTLQDQGERQIELLEKVNETLDDIHTSQAEMSGYLKGQKG